MYDLDDLYGVQGSLKMLPGPVVGEEVSETTSSSCQHPSRSNSYTEICQRDQWDLVNHELAPMDGVVKAVVDGEEEEKVPAQNISTSTPPGLNFGGWPIWDNVMPQRLAEGESKWKDMGDQILDFWSPWN
jgi:hypothetical protein